MNRNDLRRVDMNLLVIFEALMFEKNLTRVAEKLFMGQPAVSAKASAAATSPTVRAPEPASKGRLGKEPRRKGSSM